MNNLQPLETLYLIITVVQLFILATHDSVNLFPLNDINHLQESMSLKQRALMTFGNTIFVVILLSLQIIFWGQPKPIWFVGFGLLYYTSLFIMMYNQWYRLYWFGASDDVSAKYYLEYNRTLQILPARGKNPRPNLLHVILHTLFVSNAILTILIGFNLVK